MNLITKFAVGLVATAALALAPMSAFASTEYPSGSVGADISWPNCNARVPAGMPFGVVGVSDGLVYSDNPCLSSEAAKFANVSLYANTGLNADASASGSAYYKSALSTCNGDTTCAAYTYGKNAGEEAAQYALSQGVATGVTMWWLDVETGNTWNSNTAWNAQELQGERDGITAILGSGVNVGIYSTSYQWSQIVGSDWASTNTWPVWYATGGKNLSGAKASKYCSASNAFTGGSVYLVQYTAKNLDNDYAC